MRCEQRRQKLAEVEAKIAAHPLSSPPVKKAHAIIEAHGGKDDSGEVSRELEERGLPSLAELGKIQARTSFSWWWLHRKRRSLERRVAS